MEAVGWIDESIKKQRREFQLVEENLNDEYNSSSGFKQEATFQIEAATSFFNLPSVAWSVKKLWPLHCLRGSMKLYTCMFVAPFLPSPTLQTSSDIAASVKDKASFNYLPQSKCTQHCLEPLSPYPSSIIFQSALMFGWFSGEVFLEMYPAAES